MFSGTGTDYQDTTISNQFWPDLNVGDFERLRGIPADLSKDAIASSLFSAVAQVNIELQPARADLESEGYKQAAAVDTGISMNGENQLCVLYKSTVFARAKADLLPEIATVQMRDAGDNAAERKPETKASLLAESEQHLRALCGMRRVSVELI